jgi:hypothetical protein
MPRSIRALASLILVTVFLAAPTVASARVAIRVGIGNQSAAMFDQSAFQRAKFKRVRYIVPWNVMDNVPLRLTARAFVQRARAADMDVLVHVSTDDFAIRKAKLPSVATYRRQVGRIVAYFRALGVRAFGTWDEVNHASQPTWDHPGQAALFFREMYRAVKGRCSSCAVVALDVLDQVGVERYMRSFYRKLSPTYRRRATLVGIHNYGDVNRKRTRFTRSIIREAHHYNRSTRFWLTETGGIVKLGRTFPCSTTRAAARMTWMFHIARLFRTSGIQRLYIYNWTGAGCDARFDAGLTSPNGATRAGYRYLRTVLPGYLR